MVHFPRFSAPFRQPSSTKKALFLGLWIIAALTVVHPQSGQGGDNQPPSGKPSESLKYAQLVMEATRKIHQDYVVEITQGELVRWAVEGLYSSFQEKIPADLAKQLRGAEQLTADDLTALLARARERLGKLEGLNGHKDLDPSLDGVFGHLDGNSRYMTGDEVVWFCGGGNFVGAGLKLRIDETSKMALVDTPIKDGPAYQAGIRAGDLIEKITYLENSDGEPLNPAEEISTKGLTLAEVERKLKGKAKSKIHLSIRREGVDGLLVFTVSRQQVELETVLGSKRQRDDAWSYLADEDNKIGYARLTKLERNTASELTRVVEKLDKKGMKGFILDMRFNPGGLLTSAMDVSDLFIDDGTIVTIKSRTHIASFQGEREGSYLKFPMACLSNGTTASGSEIVAACLQDHKRATIIGERSYGKGSVQNIQDFEDGQLKLTVALFYRPSGKKLDRIRMPGRNADEWGVTPDQGYTINLSPKERDELADHLHQLERIFPRDRQAKETKSAFRDRQLERAVEFFREKIKKET